MTDYNTKGLDKFVSTKLKDAENGPNTSIDWIVYQAKGDKFKIQVLTVCPDVKYPFVIKNNEEIKSNGIEKELFKIFEPYESQTTAKKYGSNKKTLEQSIVSKDEYPIILKEKEKEEIQRKKTMERLQELKEEYDAQQRISLQQSGSPVKWL